MVSKMNILFAVTIIGILIGLAGVVAAQPPFDKIENAKDKYEDAKENYKEALEKYKKAKGKFNLRDKVGFQNAKKYLHTGGETSQRWLEKLKIFVERSKINETEKEKLLNEIDGYIVRIRECVDKIDGSQSPEELRENAREMKQVWMEVRLSVRSMVGQIAGMQLKEVIQRAEQVEFRLEARIGALSQIGQDTTELEELLVDYSENLEKAKENLELAMQQYTEAKNTGNMGKFLEADRYMREATKFVKMAFGDIKEFIYKVKSMKVGKGQIFFGNETGEIWVSGNGTAKFKGSAIVTVRGNGTLKVSPEDAVVSVTGYGSKIVEGGVVTIQGDGKVVVRGEGITVEITGENIRLFAKGKGTVFLDGEGIYRVKKLPEEEMSAAIQYSGNETLEIGI